MAEEKDSELQNNEAEQMPVTNGDSVIEEAEREVDLGAYVSPKSLSEAEEETRQKTDIQAILKVLTPKFSDKELNDILQPAMVSRIFPDNLLDKHKLIVLRELQRHAPTDSIDIIGIISMSQDALSIGYEGRGISDRLEIAGVVHEEEMEKLSKELGL